jgi:restriction system protein
VVNGGSGDEHRVTVAVKTLSRSLVLAIAESPELLRDLERSDMERLVAEVFTGLGFEVELTSSSKGDQGRNKSRPVQCLYRNPARPYIETR